MAKTGSRSAVHPSLGELRVVYGSKQSCIVLFDKKSGKPHLYVAVTSSQSGDHANLIQKILKHSCSKGLTKPNAVKYRNSLLAKC